MSQGLSLEANAKANVQGSVQENPEITLKELKAAISFLAAGIGLLMVSILNFLQDVTGGKNGPVGHFLTLHDGIGPYSGKQVYSIIIWMIAWVVLSKTLANTNVLPKKIMLWAYILIGVAGLLIFPPFLKLLVG